jgi:hypothetical protein
MIEEVVIFYFTGYDVFLGNFRGLVSREHIEKKISSQKYVDLIIYFFHHEIMSSFHF